MSTEAEARLEEAARKYLDHVQAALPGVDAASALVFGVAGLLRAIGDQDPDAEVGKS